MEVPTTGLEVGKYLTEIKFLHNEEIIVEEDFKFSIKHAGSVLGVRIFNLSSCGIAVKPLEANR